MKLNLTGGDVQPFKDQCGKNLYDFWGIELSTELNNIATETGTQFLLNCASKEYFSAIDVKSLMLNVVTPVFRKCSHQAQGRQLLCESRGAMARFMIQNKITTIDELCHLTLAVMLISLICLMNRYCILCAKQNSLYR